MESEFGACVKMPDMCPAEDKGPLSKGLRGEVTGHPAVHLSSINGKTKTGLYFLRVPQSSHWLPFQQLVNTLTPGRLSQRGPILSDALVTLSICRLIVLWHSTHELHLPRRPAGFLPLPCPCCSCGLHAQLCLAPDPAPTY